MQSNSRENRKQDMISSRKRKQRREFNTNYHRSRTLIHDDAEQVEQGHSYLFIQAYEADIIRGPRASQAATSLEVFDYGDQLSGMTLPVRKVGDALIQWGENRLGKLPEFPGDEDDFTDSSKQAAAQPRNDYEKNAVWVDRYVVSTINAILAQGCIAMLGTQITSYPTHI